MEEHAVDHRKSAMVTPIPIMASPVREMPPTGAGVGG
jgi:hypothetical protein